MTEPELPLRVIVAVLTYRRPDDLAAVLPMLLAQARESSDWVDLLVVDNDPDYGAHPLVQQYAYADILYVHEPTPGIAAARNRAVQLASGADILVFIDDDERPVEGWLQLLLDTYRREHPAGVVGPVVSRYAEPPDPWISAGRFFDRRRMPTGTSVTVAATNNLLLDMRQINGVKFDEEFSISGGSDTLFTRQLVSNGRRLVWCDEAVVFDEVPRTRLTRDWVLQRAFRSGNAWSRSSVRLADTPEARAMARLAMTGKGAVRLAAGIGMWSLGVLSGSAEHHARGLRTLKRGAGMVAGAWDHVYSEYARSA